MEKIEEPKSVKVSFLKLKGRASLWWDNVQVLKVKKGKDKIKARDIMVSKLKNKFLPTDYVISLFGKLQKFELRKS